MELRICSTMGETAKSIAEIAKDCHADLVVAGGSRRGVLGRLLFGDVAQRMPRLVACPVLLIPPHN